LNLSQLQERRETILKKRFLRPISIGVVFLIVTVGIIIWSVQRAQPTQAASPKRYFAPYIDMTLQSPSKLTEIASQTKQKYYTLAFIVSHQQNQCKASWGGIEALESDWGLDAVNSLIQDGGGVIISFGGASGLELAQVCKDVQSLQAQYQAVIDKYHPIALDFDIEGIALDRSASDSIDRRNKAIAGLQLAAGMGGKTLDVSYTLPISPQGLTEDGMNLMKSVIANGADIRIVNGMAMDYGSSAAPDKMGEHATSAATHLQEQLKPLYPNKEDNELWGMVGVTPMIGVNDTVPEIFTLDDAGMLMKFAQEHDIGELSYWSIARDHQCANGSNSQAQSNCSGIAQGDFTFLKIFQPFTDGSYTPPVLIATSGSPTAIVVEGTPTSEGAKTPVPTATPGGEEKSKEVKNADFETGGTGGWQCTGDASVTTSPAHGGSHALKLTSGNYDLAQCQQEIAVQAGKTYTLTAYLQGNYAFIGTTANGVNWASNSSYGSVTWKFVAQANTVTIYVHGWYGQGPIYVDDVVLQEVQ
jgi:hypothetical protein